MSEGEEQTTKDSHRGAGTVKRDGNVVGCNMNQLNTGVGRGRRQPISELAWRVLDKMMMTNWSSRVSVHAVIAAATVFENSTQCTEGNGARTLARESLKAAKVLVMERRERSERGRARRGLV
jgi:hypothetical protein